MLLQKIHQHILEGEKVNFNLSALTISFKRCKEETPADTSKTISETYTQTETPIHHLISEAYEVLQHLNRDADFVALLKCICEHLLDDSIAFHL